MGVSPRLPDREAEAVCGDWGTAGRVGLGVAPTVTAVTGGPRLLGGWGALGTGKPPGGGGGPAGDWGIKIPEIPPPPEMVTKRPGH